MLVEWECDLLEVFELERIRFSLFCFVSLLGRISTHRGTRSCSWPIEVHAPFMFAQTVQFRLHVTHHLTPRPRFYRRNPIALYSHFNLNLSQRKKEVKRIFCNNLKWNIPHPGVPGIRRFSLALRQQKELESLHSRGDSFFCEALVQKWFRMG